MKQFCIHAPESENWEVEVYPSAFVEKRVSQDSSALLRTTIK